MKLLTVTPCGLTPLITWRISPSLPEVSMPWSTTSTAQRALRREPGLVGAQQLHALFEQRPALLLVGDPVLVRGVEVARELHRPPGENAKRLDEVLQSLAPLLGQFAGHGPRASCRAVVQSRDVVATASSHVPAASIAR